ncbi:MFS transporter [Streptomyces iranensis]|uniref:MFS family permease n=1 Tax=Streptomyces iranensis TaxID=576784 RepID=A0ABS4MSN6_9ACTN|nr:MFS transporter [Streptomyces iranensis]MBP2062735.1 MFS family permease [Streptomyces iranensis]
MTTTSTAPSSAGVDRSLVRRVTWATWTGWGLDGFTNQMFPLALGGIIATFGLTTGQGGLATSCALISSAVGGVVGGRLADRFGRVQVLVLVIGAYALFTGLTATSQNFEQLLLWHTLEGLFFGAEWPVGAALMAEYAAPERRGRVLAWIQSAWSVGWAGANLAYLLSNAWLPETAAWRVMFVTGVLPALVALLIRRKLRDVPTTQVQRKPREQGAFAELFAPGLRKHTVLGTLFGASGLASTYAMQTWIPLYLKEDRGLSVSDTAMYIWFMIAGNWLGYVLGGHLHDRIGRRWAFTVFYLGTTVFGFLFMAVPLDALWYNLLLAFVVGFFISAQASGKGALFTELFPARVRGTGAGVTYNVGRGVAAFSPAFIGWAAAGSGLGRAIVTVVMICTVLTLLFIWLLPETKGRVLD